MNRVLYRDARFGIPSIDESYSFPGGGGGGGTPFDEIIIIIIIIKNTCFKRRPPSLRVVFRGVLY